MIVPEDVMEAGWAASYATPVREAPQAFMQVIALWARHQALLDAHALCTTTTDAAAIARLIEAERQEGNA